MGRRLSWQPSKQHTEPLPSGCDLSTRLLDHRQHKRCLHPQGLLPDLCPQRHRLLRLLPGLFQGIPFVGEPRQAKLCLAGIEEILFCCGKHRTVEFGSLV